MTATKSANSRARNETQTNCQTFGRRPNSPKNSTNWWNRPWSWIQLRPRRCKVRTPISFLTIRHRFRTPSVRLKAWATSTRTGRTSWRCQRTNLFSLLRPRRVRSQPVLLSTIATVTRSSCSRLNKWLYKIPCYHQSMFSNRARKHFNRICLFQAQIKNSRWKKNVREVLMSPDKNRSRKQKTRTLNFLKRTKT